MENKELSKCIEMSVLTGELISTMRMEKSELKKISDIARKAEREVRTLHSYELKLIDMYSQMISQLKERKEEIIQLIESAMSTE